MKIIDDDGRVIAEGQVLSLEAGDVVVFQAEQKLHQAERADIAASLQRVFPNNKVAVLENGDDISILRRPAKEAIA